MPKKRLLITGGSGFVAGALAHFARQDWEVHVQSRGAAPAPPEGVHWHVDTTLGTQTLEALEPHALIHAAAIADIDYCEARREEADAVNTRWTIALAERAAHTGGRFVFLSTDNVFDGAKGRYREDDPAEPVNYYGRTKRRAEEAVLALGANVAVARTAVVMGLPFSGAGNSFLARMLPQLERGEALGVPNQEIRSPIDVITLARALLELAAGAQTGILHLAGNDRLDRCTLVQRIAAAFGHDPALVRPNNPEHIPGRAPRPVDASLDNRNARAMLQTPMLGVAEGLALVRAHREPDAPYPS